MPPKATITQERIVDAAVEVVRTHGLNGLSARRVAEVLKASTAPVYHVVGSMEELGRLTILRIKSLALEEMAVPRTDRHFLNIGMGFAVFSRDEPRLFQALHLDNPYPEVLEQLFAELRQSMLDDLRFGAMSEADRGALLEKMWTFTLGMSVQITFGRVASPTDELIEARLHETGTIVIRAAIEAAQRSAN